MHGFSQRSRYACGTGCAGRRTRLPGDAAAFPAVLAQKIHGVVLAGGSAFGLSAAGGVMRYLQEHGIVFDVGVTRVPLVVQSDLFDLTVGAADVYPDEAMGYKACEKAFQEANYRDGNYGAGCGATVGKIAGMERCMKTGVGSYALQEGELKIGAIVALNALGDVFDWKSGRQIAGMLTEDGSGIADTSEVMKKRIKALKNRLISAKDSVRIMFPARSKVWEESLTSRRST